MEREKGSAHSSNSSLTLELTAALEENSTLILEQKKLHEKVLGRRGEENGGGEKGWR